MGDEAIWIKWNGGSGGVEDSPAPFSSSRAHTLDDRLRPEMLASILVLRVTLT